MASVKTAVSLPKPLFEQAEALARELGTSRSELFARALEEYLRREETKRLMKQMNEAWAEDLDEEEQASLEAMRRLYAKTLEPEEW